MRKIECDRCGRSESIKLSGQDIRLMTITISGESRDNHPEIYERDLCSKCRKDILETFREVFPRIAVE